jgi:hypothetical protein
MEWKQLRAPDVHKPCIPGYCLTYVQDVFGVPAKEPSALADWNNNTYNHANSNFPDGVAVPIWFSGKHGVLKQFGHVAVRMPDGSVWSCSHPTSNEPMHFDSIDSLNQYYSYQLIYLGWTEDVEDVRVIEKGEAMTDQEAHDVGTAVYRAVYGREPENGKVAIAMGKSLATKSGVLTPASVIAGLQGQRKAAEWKERNEKAKAGPAVAAPDINKAAVIKYLTNHLK